MHAENRTSDKMNKVINFHELHDPVWFEKVVVYLKNRYTMVGSRDLYEYYYNHTPLRNACLITVDDGHSTSYDVIYPVLKKHKVPAIFFVSPEIAKREEAVNFWFQEIRGYDEDKLRKIAFDFLNITPTEAEIQYIFDKTSIDNMWEIISRYRKLYHVEPKAAMNMTVEQIRQIDKEGLVEIGAHTLTHPFLARETVERSMNEIKGSISQLEGLLQHPVFTFAYPNGRPVLDFGEREMQMLTDTSIKLAFSTRPHNFSMSDDVFAIPRYGLSCGSMNFVKLKLFLGKYYPLLRCALKIGQKPS